MPAAPAAPAAAPAAAPVPAAARPDESNVKQDKCSAGGEEDVSIETAVEGAENKGAGGGQAENRGAGGEEDVSIETAVEEAENRGGGASSYSQVCLTC